MISNLQKNIKQENIEKLNRDNFRVIMECMSRPGLAGSLTPVFGSAFIAAASTLLYKEMTWCAVCDDDFSDIKLLTGSSETSIEKADYIFFGAPDAEVLEAVKRGTYESPELGATIFFKCANREMNKVLMTGPGIDVEKTVYLPVDGYFADSFNRINSKFPIGVDVFFIDNSNRVTGISRTTRLEMM